MRTCLRMALSSMVVASVFVSQGVFAQEEVTAESTMWMGGMVPRPDGSFCPALNVLRTPEQVFAARIAAVEAGDIDAVMCTYAVDAVVVFPGAPMTGLANIRAAFEQMFMMMGGESPTVTTMTTVGEVVMTTFFYDGPIFSIPDGSDTYVIRHGYIKYQTVHNSLVFNQPPAAP